MLAQNNAELRATGGIPTAWSTLTVENGGISMGTFADPPRDGLFSQDEAMSVLTADERTLFSTKMATDAPDINFTPDFPRVADIARRIWQRSGHGDVDGVISVDPVVPAASVGDRRSGDVVRRHGDGVAGTPSSGF